MCVESNDDQEEGDRYPATFIMDYLELYLYILHLY